MSPEEAIKVIQSNYPPENYTRLREALDLAISLLEERRTPPVVFVGSACPVCASMMHFSTDALYHIRTCPKGCFQAKTVAYADTKGPDCYVLFGEEHKVYRDDYEAAAAVKEQINKAIKSKQ